MSYSPECCSFFAASIHPSAGGGMGRPRRPRDEVDARTEARAAREGALGAEAAAAGPPRSCPVSKREATAAAAAWCLVGTVATGGRPPGPADMLSPYAASPRITRKRKEVSVKVKDISNMHLYGHCR